LTRQDVVQEVIDLLYSAACFTGCCATISQQQSGGVWVLVFRYSSA